MSDHVVSLRIHEHPFSALLQTVLFSKRQGCLTKLRRSRDSYRIIALDHNHEHQFDGPAQQSQVSQDVL